MRRSAIAAIATFVVCAPQVLHAGQAWTGITGGVGEESRAAMMSRYGDFNLHLGFAEADGSFLADLSVVVRDNRGNVVYHGPSVGPWLFIEVPPGTYRVTARHGDLQAERTVVARDGQRGITYFHLR